MKNKPANPDANDHRGHSHGKHMKMMLICCGVPIAGFLAIGYLGLSMPSLETFLFLICALGMVAMVYMMRRDVFGGGKNDAASDFEKAPIIQDDDVKENR